MDDFGTSLFFCVVSIDVRAVVGVVFVGSFHFLHVKLKPSVDVISMGLIRRDVLFIILIHEFSFDVIFKGFLSVPCCCILIFSLLVIRGRKNKFWFPF